MSALLPAELRDLRQLDSLARRVTQQTGHLRRNMADHDTHDRLRYGLVQILVAQMDDIVLRCMRRADKLKGAK